MSDKTITDILMGILFFLIIGFGLIKSCSTNDTYLKKDELEIKILQQEETIDKLMTENSILRTLIKNEAEATSWELRNQK